jgi:N4-gp56 family major capsid protein
MAGQVWQTNSLGGYMFSVNLSRKLRTALQPMVRFRQFCDAKEAFGLGKGDLFNWNVYSDVEDQGGTLNETQTMPETNFTIGQATLTVTEYGNSVPYTQKLDDLSEHPVTEIIHKVLKNDARKALDTAAFNQFDASQIRVVGSGAAGSEVIEVTENGTAAATTNVALTAPHVKLVADEMAERDIPTYDGVNYMALFRPRALRAFKDELEAIHQYVSEGWHVIMNGEKGRYEGVRFVEHTNISRTTLQTGWGTPDATGARDKGFFFGQDTVVEAFSIPEEIRGKIPTDFGRSRGIAWYAILGYGIVHNDSANPSEGRILVWDSQA